MFAQLSYRFNSIVLPLSWPPQGGSAVRDGIAAIPRRPARTSWCATAATGRTPASRARLPRPGPGPLPDLHALLGRQVVLVARLHAEGLVELGHVRHHAVDAVRAGSVLIGDDQHAQELVAQLAAPD